MNTQLRSFIDTLRKADAKSRLPSGGNKFLTEVALGPSASAKNQALLRNQKVTPQEVMPLRKLVKGNM